jgi:uncharacterized protein YdbL (DUF1318 family)
MTMTQMTRVFVLGAALLASACVTVNVYFPAAAAESAADAVVKEVYGIEAGKPPPSGQKPADDDDASAEQAPVPVAVQLLDLLLPGARAQTPQIDIDTPAVNTLTTAMRERHAALQPHYGSGAIGMANTGLITVRDSKAVGIRERAAVNQWVAEENRDRNALYGEVARANGHPEWEPQIRAIFAQRWVANAPAGWWFQETGGGWRQK